MLVIRNPDGSALDPGTWFVRVQNDTSVQVNFTISVSFEFITAHGEIRLFLFPLTGGGLRLQWNSDPGATYERKFEAAGRFEITCSPHPFMKSVVEVKP